MLRLDYPEYTGKQLSIVEVLLPSRALELPPDLDKVDRILNGNSFEELFIEKFYVATGRGATPIRPFIRLMALKRANSWGYKTLENEVNHNVMLKKFCRIPLEKSAPHSTTLMKLNKKYGEDTMNKLFEMLEEKLVEHRVIHGRKSGIDSTGLNLSSGRSKG